MEGVLQLTMIFPVCEDLLKQNVHKIKNKSHTFLLRKNYRKQQLKIWCLLNAGNTPTDGKQKIQQKMKYPRLVEWINLNLENARSWTLHHIKENICESVLRGISDGTSVWMKGFILQTESSRTPHLATYPLCAAYLPDGWGLTEGDVHFVKSQRCPLWRKDTDQRKINVKEI